jgi:hypothetical protein
MGFYIATEMPEQVFKDETKSVDYWLSELRSPDVSPRNKNELKDTKESHDLADNIKLTMYSEYKMAYASA